MNRIYLLNDPWELETAGEHFRFRETADIIRKRIGNRFGSILEIGCGEGLQTEYLALLAQQIVGLDPSSRAIKKAKSGQIANATFMVGDLMKYNHTLRLLSILLRHVRFCIISKTWTRPTTN